MKINYFCKVYNEERILPYVFRHYDQFVDHYFIWNHASTDKTRELLAKNPKVTIIDLSAGLFDDTENMNIKNSGWQQYAKDCDWVIICDFDEFLYHPDLLNILEKYKTEGITFPYIDGYQMFAEEFPKTDKQIYDVVKTGKKASNYCKHMIFNPSVSPNYYYGAHQAFPTGLNVKYSASAELKLLHYKIFGESFVNEMMQRNDRLSPKNKSLGQGAYSLNPGCLFNPKTEYELLKKEAVQII